MFGNAISQTGSPGGIRRGLIWQSGSGMIKPWFYCIEAERFKDYDASTSESWSWLGYHVNCPKIGYEKVDGKYEQTAYFTRVTYMPSTKEWKLEVTNDGGEEWEILGYLSISFQSVGYDTPHYESWQDKYLGISWFIRYWNDISEEWMVRGFNSPNYHDYVELTGFRVSQLGSDGWELHNYGVRVNGISAYTEELIGAWVTSTSVLRYGQVSPVYPTAVIKLNSNRTWEYTEDTMDISICTFSQRLVGIQDYQMSPHNGLIANESKEFTVTSLVPRNAIIKRYVLP